MQRRKRNKLYSLKLAHFAQRMDAFKRNYAACYIQVGGPLLCPPYSFYTL